VIKVRTMVRWVPALAPGAILRDVWFCYTTGVCH